MLQEAISVSIVGTKETYTNEKGGESDLKKSRFLLRQKDAITTSQSFGRTNS